MALSGRNRSVMYRVDSRTAAGSALGKGIAIVARIVIRCILTLRFLS
jgi:hypothetical protein